MVYIHTFLFKLFEYLIEVYLKQDFKDDII